MVTPKAMKQIFIICFLSVGPCKRKKGLKFGGHLDLILDTENPGFLRPLFNVFLRTLTFW